MREFLREEEVAEGVVVGGWSYVWRAYRPLQAFGFPLDEMRSHGNSEQGLTSSLTFLNVHPGCFVQTRQLGARAEQGTSRRLLLWSWGENPGLNEGASHENSDKCPYSGSIPKANPLGFADGMSVSHGGKNDNKDDSRILACTPGRTLVREEIWN